MSKNLINTLATEITTTVDTLNPSTDRTVDGGEVSFRKFYAGGNLASRLAEATYGYLVKADSHLADRLKRMEDALDRDPECINTSTIAAIAEAEAHATLKAIAEAMHHEFKDMVATAMEEAWVPYKTRMAQMEAKASSPAAEAARKRAAALRKKIG